jgi:hypothetical protein
MHKLLLTTALTVIVVGAVASGMGPARPAAADCAVCMARAGMMNSAATQAPSMADIHADILARLAALGLRLPG